MIKSLSNLPALDLIKPISNGIRSANLVIGAPPGAGKSTVVPLSILDLKINGKILLLQPRRVVVRNLASYLASLLGQVVGDTVGYRIRGESKGGANTRLEIITEGVLVNMIRRDPELSGIGAIIFDEFHERSLFNDFSLALAIDVQNAFRQDLRLIVMSATLDVDPLCSLLDLHCDLPFKQLHIEGRTFPVTVHYDRDSTPQDTIKNVSKVVTRAYEHHDGDILVFLPGRSAIERVLTELQLTLNGVNVEIHTLYGALTKEKQQLALMPSAKGYRKIILATNIAETSLTIEGIKVVVDSLLENKASYSHSSGFTQLVTQRISQASATQRLGRAGRVSAGHCYRMCSQSTFERLNKFTAPEIETSDLTSFVLNTLSWGAKPNELALLSMPPDASLASAYDILEDIGATDQYKRITSWGNELAKLPCHPRLANMLLICKNGHKGVSLELVAAMKVAAAFVVALVEDMSSSYSHLFASDSLLALPHQSIGRLTAQAKRYASYLDISPAEIKREAIDDTALAACIALAFPQFIALQREGKQSSKHYKLAGGKGAKIEREFIGESIQWLAVMDGHQQGGDVTIRLAQPIDQNLLEVLFPQQFKQHRVVTLNTQLDVMEYRVVKTFFAIELESIPATGEDKRQHQSFWNSATVSGWESYLRVLPVDRWPLKPETKQWWNRVKLAALLNLHQKDAYDEPEPWPTSVGVLLPSVLESVSGQLAICMSAKQLEKIDWHSAMNNSLTWPQQSAIKTQLPEHIETPNGRKVKLRYEDDGRVIASTRLQDMFGQHSPVTLANGKVTVLFELLSPARRPLQTTADLGAFWQGSYKEIQKEMKGRYPKHNWELP